MQLQNELIMLNLEKDTNDLKTPNASTVLEEATTDLIAAYDYIHDNKRVKRKKSKSAARRVSRIAEGRWNPKLLS